MKEFATNRIYKSATIIMRANSVRFKRITDDSFIIQPRLSYTSQAKSTDDIVLDIAKQLLKGLPSTMTNEK